MTDPKSLTTNRTTADPMTPVERLSVAVCLVEAVVFALALLWVGQ